MLPAEEMGELLLRIQGHLFEVNGVQQKRQLYWLLRYFQQELDDSKDSCFRTPAMVLGQGEDWVLFHLDEFEKSYRWAQNPSGLKPSDPCECVIRSVDLIAREMTGVLEVADRNQGEKRN